MRRFDEFCPKFFAASRRDFSIKISLADIYSKNTGTAPPERKGKRKRRAAKPAPAAIVDRKAGQAAEERYRDAKGELMIINNSDLYPGAQEIVCKEIRDDPELYTAFQANIAMAFMDSARWNQARKNKRGRPISWTDMREIANEAADYFLKQWTAKNPPKQ